MGILLVFNNVTNAIQITPITNRNNGIRINLNTLFKRF